MNDPPVTIDVIQQVKPGCESEFEQVLTGLETWFTLTPQQALIPPPRYKMLIVTYLAGFPTANVINVVLQPLIQPLPVILRSLLTTVLLLTLMTYVIMPRMTKLFESWLYPKSEEKTA